MQSFYPNPTTTTTIIPAHFINLSSARNYVSYNPNPQSGSIQSSPKIKTLHYYIPAIFSSCNLTILASYRQNPTFFHFQFQLDRYLISLFPGPRSLSPMHTGPIPALMVTLWDSL